MNSGAENKCPRTRSLKGCKESSTPVCVLWASRWSSGGRAFLLMWPERRHLLEHNANNLHVVVLKGGNNSPRTSTVAVLEVLEESVHLSLIPRTWADNPDLKTGVSLQLLREADHGSEAPTRPRPEKQPARL